MKQKMKRIWLGLCMAFCLFALAGCTKADTAGDEIDPQILMVIQQGVPQTLDSLTAMTDEDLQSQLQLAEKNKDTIGVNMLTSWESVKGDLGGLVSAETPVVELGDDGYIARMNTQFEQRACEFTVMIDDELAITSVSFTPEYTVGEKMTKAALNTVMGMGVVFVVLIFISWLISCFKYINKFEENMKKKEAEKAAANAPAAAPAPVPAAAPAPVPAAAPAPAAVPVPAAAAPVPQAPVQEEIYADDSELISVIAAAIAASEGKKSADELVVRSIKRVPSRNWK